MTTSNQYSIIECLELGILILDVERRVSLWNGWMERASGILRNSALDRTLPELFPDVAGSRLQQTIEQAITYGISGLVSPGLNRPVMALYQKTEDRKYERRMQQLLHIIPIELSNAMGCIVQVQDVTATVRREKRLRVQAVQLRDANYRDQLTGIGNRRRFDDALEDLFKKGKEGKPSDVSLLMIDIDHFKEYNDHYGHPKGDLCLKAVAQSLFEGLRQTGDQICRIGGEEFAVILPSTDEKLAVQIAERLRLRVEAMRLSHDSSRSGRHVTVSIGVASVRAVPETDFRQQLVSMSDAALYHAKHDGRNRAMLFHATDGSIQSVA